jgi:hypothetical protein
MQAKGEIMNTFVRKLLLGAAAAALALQVASVSAQSKDPRLGDWKLNVAKSKYSPGPAPKSIDLKIEAAGKGTHTTAVTVTPDGKTITQEYTANYDGKDVPLAGSALANTTSLKRVNKLTTLRTDKKDGKVVATLRSTVSKDGKLFTVEVKAKTPKGEPVKNTLVFERQ